VVTLVPFLIAVAALLAVSVVPFVGAFALLVSSARFSCGVFGKRARTSSM